MNNIIPVYNIDDLKQAVDNYDQIAMTKNSGESSNNKNFNEKVEKIVNNLVKE